MLSRAGRILKMNSTYLWLGTILFFASGLLGYLNADSIQSMAQELLKELERIADKIQHNNSPLYTFWVIFQNNVIASLSMVGLGVFFGIYPILALISNGILLGFMLKSFAMKGVDPFSILAVGILPHGVIEIFAVILAASIGIKYGIVLFRLLGSLADGGRRSSLLDEFKESLRDLPFIIGSVIVLLFLAAVIESTVTPFLIHTFMGDTV